jgi:hypothetical protein
MSQNVKNRMSFTQNTQISNDLVISNTNNLINTLTNTVVNNNNIYLVNNVVSSNIIQLSNISCEGDINVQTVDQTNNITIQIQNQIQTSVANNIKQNIQTEIVNSTTNQQPPESMIKAITQKNADALKAYNEAAAAQGDAVQEQIDIANNLNGESSDVGKGAVKGAVAGTILFAPAIIGGAGILVGTLLGAAGGALAAAIDPDTTTVNLKTDLSNDVSQVLGIKSSAVSTTINNVTNNNAFSTAVNNLVQMINQISAQNIISAASISCGGNFNINDIQQINNIKAAFNNSFNTSIVNNISIQISTSIKNIYQSFYTNILENAPTQPDVLTIAQIDNAETMQLISWYALAQGSSPDAIKLKCLIQKRLLEIGGPSAPEPTSECIALGLVTAPVPKNNPPASIPEPNGPPVTVGQGPSGTNVFKTGADSHISAPTLQADNKQTATLKAGNQQTDNKQAGNQQVDNQPAGNQPAGNQQVDNKQAGNQPVGNQQVGNQQAGNQQAGNQQANPANPNIYYIIGGVFIVIIILILLLKK